MSRQTDLLKQNPPTRTVKWKHLLDIANAPPKKNQLRACEIRQFVNAFNDIICKPLLRRSEKGGEWRVKAGVWSIKERMSCWEFMSYKPAFKHWLRRVVYVNACFCHSIWLWCTITNDNVYVWRVHQHDIQRWNKDSVTDCRINYILIFVDLVGRVPFVFDHRMLWHTLRKANKRQIFRTNSVNVSLMI